jgi:hypothetical protein
MNWDLNDADKQQGVIPEDEYLLKSSIQEGGYGANYLLHRSKNGSFNMLVIECTVASGEHRGRKFKEWIIVEYLGNERDPEKAEKAKTAERIGRAKMRAMLESARGIDPDDDSDAAKAARRFESLTVFNGLQFTAHVAIRPGQSGYREQNYIYQVIHTGKPSESTVSPAPTTVPPKPRKDDFDDSIPF